MNENAPPRARLSGAEELTVAMTTAAEFAKTHHHADLKVSALLVVHGGLAAATAGQATPIWEIFADGGVHRWIVLILLGLFGLGFLAGGYYLVQSLRPRTTPPAGANRFAFADLSSRSSPPARTSARDQCEEAWKLARMLSAIAVVKFRYASLALGWIAFMLVDFLALTAYVTVGRTPWV